MDALDALMEQRRTLARRQGENDAYERIIKQLMEITELPAKKAVSLDPFVWLDRGINAALDGLESLVKRLVTRILR